MAYKINENLTDNITIPKIIIEKLPFATENSIRVALFIAADKITQPDEIAARLSISLQEVQNALAFWQGAGLIEQINTTIAEPIFAKRPTRLTSREVVRAAKQNPEIAILITECQNIFGAPISESDSAILVSLYVNDGMPLDFILTGVAHFVSIGKRGTRYIERALISWQEAGIKTGADAENYLMLLETRAKREKAAADIIGIKDAKFTTAEQKLISDWFEEFGFNEQMVQLAAMHAGDKLTVRYINGILKNWYGKGYKNPRDVRSSTNITNAVVTPTLRGGKTGTSKVMQRNIGKEIDFGDK